jgi:hypothetical protein
LIASAATASATGGKRGVVETKNAIAFIPARGAFVLDVDQRRDAADIIGDTDATMRGAKQQSAAEAPALHRSIDAEAAETEHRHVVTRQAFVRELQRPRIVGATLGSACRSRGRAPACRTARRRNIWRRRIRGSDARIFADRD